MNNMTIEEKINKKKIGKIEKNVSLSQYTTYKAGGKPKLIVYPKNIDKLVDNAKLKLYNPKKAILSDEIHSTISVKTIKGVSLTGLGINDNLSTVMK